MIEFHIVVITQKLKIKWKKNNAFPLRLTFNLPTFEMRANEVRSVMKTSS